ncbi:MAG: alpha-galactosidase [Anaerolineae bacterium]
MSDEATAQEQRRAQAWIEAAFGPGKLPLSFRYGEAPSADLIASWDGVWSELPSAPDTTRRAWTLTDPKSGLQCRCEVTTFAHHPAVEWVCYLKNTGSTDTPILEDIQALELAIPVGAGQVCHVHHAKGSTSQADDFQPQETPLNPRRPLRIASIGGRSSDGALPFFNLDMGAQGVIGAIGWSGDWAATFARSEEGVQVRAGMQRTHLLLHPGEEIRTPRILLVFWEGERLHGHNLLRRIIISHYTPRPNGQMLKVPISDGAWGERCTADQVAKVAWLKEQNLGMEFFWIDAGWHGDNTFDPQADTFGTAWAVQVGNWWPNKTTYPDGLKPIGEACREAGLGFLLWFEPERAFQGTEFTRTHPEWLLGPVPSPWLKGDNYCFNLGIPEARKALTERISGVIGEGGITCFRQDFNFQPAPFWAAADAPDRQGMTEIRHIEGLYAFWDELLARHPGLIIDNCASGGRRIDLETTMRSVPLWRSDVQCAFDFDPISQQTQTQGLGMWVPLSGGCCRKADRYALRSALGSGIHVAWSEPTLEGRKVFPMDLVKELMAEEVAVREYFYGDFSPLTPYSEAADAWTAWQFDRPDLGEGMVLALRRPQSSINGMQAQLRGLDPAAQYAFHNLETGEIIQYAGRDLMRQGLLLCVPEKPGSLLLVYKRIDA